MKTNYLVSETQVEEIILEAIPQQFPFRFVDRLLEINEDSVVGTYRFREEEYFYQGHFKDNPITPGVILIECMAQIGLVAQGIYLESLRTPMEEIKAMRMLFTRSDVEFLKIVYPGERVIVEAKKTRYRFGTIKSKVEMKNEKGQVVCYGTLTGKLLKNA